MKDVDLVSEACIVLQIGSERFFREASDYWEKRISGKRRSLLFVDFVKHDKVPEYVVDYALEVLAGRVT